MAVPIESIWAIEPHTKAKHEILRRYLSAWFPILASKNKRIIYVDGFAGPGRYSGGEPGSPVIALGVAAHHSQVQAGEVVFWFIDERRDRILHLTQELRQRSIPPHFKVHTETGRFDTKLVEVLDLIEDRGSQLAPTFAFIDPFGFSGIPFRLISRLLRHQKSEAFITFMVDAINRFLEHPDDSVQQHIVEAFGTNEAIRVARSPGDRISQLRALYQQRLRMAARFVRYFEMRDRQNRVQYYLFFATNHELGHIKMKEAMWALDPDGEFSFSDATNPNQLVLFENDSTATLAADLRSKYEGRGKVVVSEVRKYVENETPYLRKHMRTSLLREEEAGRIRVDPQKPNGRKRKAGSFPDEARLEFV
jgi:three-Cys-motif partner protein